MSETTTRTFRVPDMSCQHCIDSITKEVSVVDSVESVAVDLDTKLVTVAGGADDAIIEAIDEAGFDVATDQA